MVQRKQCGHPNHYKEHVMKRSLFAAVAILSSFFATETLARSVVNKNANLRAGPDADYPAVVKLRRGTSVDVYGCIDRWFWCDVQAGRYRGWVRGDLIDTWYKKRRTGFVQAAPHLDVPMVSFNISYWDSYYRDRPFYRDRDQWRDRWQRDHGRWNDNDRHDRDDWRKGPPRKY